MMTPLLRGSLSHWRLALTLTAILAALLAWPNAARAQSDTLWSATLVAKAHVGDQVGCSNTFMEAARKCSTATTLSDDDFTLGATTYSIINLWWQPSSVSGTVTTPPRVVFQLDQDVPATLAADYSLFIDSLTVPPGKIAVFSLDADRMYAEVEGLTWTTGQSISLSLRPFLSVGDCDPINNTATPPTNPAITGATVSGTSVTLSWNPSGTTPDGGSVTNYIVFVYKADETLRSARYWDFLGHENAATTYTETLTGLEANTAYEARVRARTIKGCRSGFSAIESFTTGAGGL